MLPANNENPMPVIIATSESDVKKLVLSNSGSVFLPHNMPKAKDNNKPTKNVTLK